MRVVSFEPEVTVQDGSVTLSGTVGSNKARRAAARNRLEVAYGPAR